MARITGVHQQFPSLEGFQDFVSQAGQLTAVNGVPGAGQFRSEITNRAPMPDVTSDLKARMGIERIETHDIFQIEDEVGPNGEPVFGVLSDSFNRIRFYGKVGSQNVSNGPTVILGTDTTDESAFCEVTFYGTGLNILIFTTADALDYKYNIDGGSETDLSGLPSSFVLTNRRYANNGVVNVAAGLSLGIHTIRLFKRGAEQTHFIHGFDIINEAAQITVNPGTAFVSGSKLESTAADTFDFNTGFESGTLGTRGGRVLVYMKSDGTIAKSLTPTNASQADLTSADHTNEEITRSIFWREFGSDRTDDFSTLKSSATDRAFTLDDGTTTLVGDTVSVQATDIGVRIAGVGLSLILTFVGTGLDISYQDDTTGTDTDTVDVDGSTIGTLTAAGSTSPKFESIVSGLPYGTHTVRFTRTTAANRSRNYRNFIIYGPKKPALPEGAIELSDYNIMADFVQTVSEGLLPMSTGVLRKQPTREFIYTGAGWSVGTLAPTSQHSGFGMTSTTLNDALSYTFFGTGIDLRINSEATVTYTLSFDGDTDFSGLTTNLLGAGGTWTPAAGTLTGNTTIGSSLALDGLPLGVHTFKIEITTAGGGGLFPNCIDVITPIYSPKGSFPADYQSTFSIGSTSLGDTRELTPIKDGNNLANWGRAVGTVNNPTTTVTSDIFPIEDMAVVIKTTGGPIEINFTGTFAHSATVEFFIGIVVDGQRVGPLIIGQGAASEDQALSITDIVQVGPGVHHIAVHWGLGSGTLTGKDQDRILTVKEI